MYPLLAVFVTFPAFSFLYFRYASYNEHYPFNPIFSGAAIRIVKEKVHLMESDEFF
ncbi:hypothetical protein APHDU1_1519 [Anaplasma phagocytophilum]|nr:hypothetical protein APHDU1_1519 [Anaplasma phagocytophilum]